MIYFSKTGWRNWKIYALHNTSAGKTGKMIFQEMFKVFKSNFPNIYLKKEKIFMQIKAEINFIDSDTLSNETLKL